MVNVFNTVYLTKLASEHFANRSGHSAIVNLSSVNGVFGYPRLASYAGGKRLIYNLTLDQLTGDKESGIDYHVITPGPTATNQNFNLPPEWPIMESAGDVARASIS
jgi:short-subunit dehydrogenase